MANLRLRLRPLNSINNCSHPRYLRQGSQYLFTTTSHIAKEVPVDKTKPPSGGRLRKRRLTVTKSEATEYAKKIDTGFSNPVKSWNSLKERLQHVGKLAPAEKPRRSEPKGSILVSPSGNSGSKSSRKLERPSTTLKSTRLLNTLNLTTVRPYLLKIQPIGANQHLEIPELSHNLDRVLFNPGVYELRDRRSGVWNFDPYLDSIMPVDEFDYNAIKSYITSSKDTKLRKLCKEHGGKYCGSTSSMTTMLSHFHYLLSGWRKPNMASISRSLVPESNNFTQLTRGPAAVILRYKDGVYGIDADKEFDSESVLSMLGKSMEKLLTLPKAEFEKYRKSRSHQLSDDQKNADEAYHYSTFGDFMMRSQLDARDSRLPGNGVFDLKTRAVVTIRMDVQGYQKGLGYELRQRTGQWESFEREYYDMIRSAFLKYSLQVRMGRMDGIFVAYHNTQRIFGFQYISLEEMDMALHHTSNKQLGDGEFKTSLFMLNDLLNKATEKFPGKSLRIWIETRPTIVPMTYFFASPISESEADRAENARNSSAEQIARKFQQRSQTDSAMELQQEQEPGEEILSSDAIGDDLNMDAQNQAAWDEMMAKVDDALEDESLGVETIREAIQQVLEQRGLLLAKSTTEAEQDVDALVEALTADSSSGTVQINGEGEEHTEYLDEDAEVSGNSQTWKTTEDSNNQVPAEEELNRATTLRQLILKVTETIEDRSDSLRAFERAFAELAGEPNRSRLTNDDASQSAAESHPAEPSEEANNDRGEKQPSGAKHSESQEEIIGLHVTARHQVNGQYVDQVKIEDKDKDQNLVWTVQYNIGEMSDQQAHKILRELKQRRRKILDIDPVGRDKNWYYMYGGKLADFAEKGRVYRKKVTKEDEGKKAYGSWDTKPIS